MSENNYFRQIPHQLFENQVLASKDAIAVFSENKVMTYDVLNRSANQLANYMRQTLGVKSGDAVGVCCDHEPARVLLLMAIAKADAVYVPVDPHYPADLINYMTDKITAKFILTNRAELLAKSDDLSSTLINLDKLDYSQYEDNNLLLEIASQSPMYIIFTSGSTGRPKAVAVSHQAAHNHFSWVMDYTSFTAADCWLQTINPSFDPSMHELMAPLMIGGSIALIGGTRKLDSREITDAIIRHQATHITTVPTMLTLLVNTPNFSDCHSLKHVCVGGEVFRPALAIKALSQLPSTCFHNVYGPTEATIMASGWLITEPEKRDALPIGPAIYNMKFYLEDDDGKIIDINPGSEGQLCISGISLANGYVNDETLTNEKFVENPLMSQTQSIYDRLYYSGDRCRVDEHGHVYCLGRMDDQVKINGQRVELAEIEYQFSELAEVNDVAALMIDGDLVVAVAPTTEPLDKIEWLKFIREQVAKKLPSFMLPKWMKMIDCIPRQAVSAKADRKKLTEMLAASSEKSVESSVVSGAMTLSVEQTISGMLDALIGDSSGLSIEVDSSFADLGIDSVDLQMLTLKLSTHFNVEIRTEDLFEYYTIEKLSNYIKTYLDEAV